MRRKALLVCIVLFLVPACTLPAPSPEAGVTQTAPAPVIPTPTDTAAPLPDPSGEPSLTPAPPPQGEAQFLAYIQDGQLLVTDVTNGVQGGTTQYTLAGESDQVSDLVWSPSGEFVAFVSSAGAEPHVFYIYALGQSSPIDLGAGTTPAWSPDSQSVAFLSAGEEENIWVTPIENPAPRQLTFETNYFWGRPAPRA